MRQKQHAHDDGGLWKSETVWEKALSIQQRRIDKLPVVEKDHQNSSKHIDEMLLLTHELSTTTTAYWWRVEIGNEKIALRLAPLGIVTSD